MSIPIVKLENPIQPYDWGARDAISALQGRQELPGRPEAELWIGDHARAPSCARLAEGDVPLPEWISRNPGALGAGRQQLPFLVKILAAARSLSVQVHPDAEQAARGFAREVAAGISNAERCYSDPNPKHEVLIALTRFEALCGFRSDAETHPLLAGFPSLAGVHDEPGDLPLSVRLFFRLQSLTPEMRTGLTRELTSFAGGEGREAAWTARLAAEHPGDPLALAPVLLNPVVLEPGQGLIVRPGTVHSYLSGTGVEVMTPSDNVIRGGLTPKHVDPREIAVVALPETGPAETTLGVASGAGETSYVTGTDAFEIRVRSLDAGEITEMRGGSVTILLCVDGDVGASGGNAEVSLGGGEAALIPAGIDRYRLLGRASTSKVFVVSSG